MTENQGFTPLTLGQQRDLLWGKAQRVMNKSNSADDTWVEIPKSCLDELGQALLATSGPDTEGDYMIPSIGRTVLYKLNQQDADAINGRRNDGRLHQQKCNIEGGHQADIAKGNGVSAGDVYPLVITRAWGATETSSVNGQVLLDGNDTLWVTSVSQSIPDDAVEHSLESLPERHWMAPPRV